MKYMFYDYFSEEYVKTTDPYAPPERYIKTYRNDMDFYEETYFCKGGLLLSIAYTPEEYHNSEIHNWKIIEMQKKHNASPTRLAYWTIPSEKFDEYAKDFGITFKEDE